MKVLFSSGAFWPIIGGVEVRAAKLLPALRDRGYEFIVVTGQSHPGSPPQDNFRGIPIYRFPFGDIGPDVSRLIKVRQGVLEVASRFAPDLIHRNGVGGDSFFSLTAAKSASVPFLVTLINDLRTQSLSQDSLYGNLLQTADWVNTVSEAALTQLRQLLPDVISRSSVVHNGIDGNAFAPKPLPADYPRLLCLGRLDYQKGIDIALRAFAAVLRQVPRVRLVIVGDGRERTELRRQADQSGVARSIDFMGWVAPEQVPEIIGSATMLVMPSRWEGLPNAALQAAMMGRPIVGARVGGLPEIVENQQTGLLVEPEDSNALADAIVSLLKNPQKLFRLGQAAHAKVEKEFTWHRYVESYDALYRKLSRSKAQ